MSQNFIPRGQEIKKAKNKLSGKSGYCGRFHRFDIPNMKLLIDINYNAHFFAVRKALASKLINVKCTDSKIRILS